MKLIVFGATGKTGRHVVEMAIQQNHTVTAFARTPAKLNLAHANLTIVQGDVLDANAVERAIAGHDAVISVLGDGEKRSTLRTDGTKQIMAAMQKNGIQRFISTSTLGVRDSSIILPPLYKYFLVPFILKHAFADHANQEEAVEKSNLDWTIVRPSALTDGVYTGSYQHGFPSTKKGLKLKISRADVAAFILKQVSDKAYLHKAPGLSY
jgi:putative NADH-flavin reductase